jgi:hypothetical protein
MIVGTILTGFALASAFSGANVLWYGTFEIGLTLLFGSINLFLNNESIFSMPNKKVLKIFLLYFIMGAFTEVLGKFILDLWITHPAVTPLLQVFEVYLFAYPFVFLSIQESFFLLRRFIKSNVAAFLIVYLFATFSAEIPNTFIWEWVYTIPYVTLEILQINIAVIIGWMPFVLLPLIVLRLLK